MGPGGGGGKGFGTRRAGSMEKGGIGPADGSTGDWLGSSLGFLGRGPVVRQHGQWLAGDVNFPSTLRTAV